MNEKEERTWAAITHLGGLAAVVFHFGAAGLAAALVLWVLKRHDAAFVDEQGKEAVNFQITMLILSILAGILSGLFYAGSWAIHGFGWHTFSGYWTNFHFWRGYILVGLVQTINMIFCIFAAIRAGQGVHFRYPVSLRLVR